MNVKSPAWRDFIGLWLGLIVILLTPAAWGAGEFDRGLLWKIEKPGLEPSYLFGTMHSEDPAVVRLPPPVRQAFDQAQALTLEVVLDPTSLLAMTSAFMLADGASLREQVGERLYGDAVKALSAYGMPEAMVARMKPWAVAVTLMTPPPQGGVMLDLSLYQQAAAAGKPVDGLETPLEQLSVFEDLPARDQRVMLANALAHLDGIERELAQLKAAYLARDLAKLVELSDASLATLGTTDADTARRFNQKLIIERNRRMAERLPSRLRPGRRFIAVGALHLPGEQGLLKLLRQRGYRVTSLY